MSEKTILAFEPDAAYAEMLQAECRSRGYSVFITSDGNEGMDYASANRPALIYLSVELPKMSGFSICNKLRKTEETLSIPLIISSSDSKSEEAFEKHKKLKVRADGYMLKPFTRGKLVAEISALLSDFGSGDDDIAIEDMDDAGGDIAIDDTDTLGDFEELSGVEEVSVSDDLADDMGDLQDVEEFAVDDETDVLTEQAFDDMAIPEKKPAPAAPPASPAASGVSAAQAAEQQKALDKLEKEKKDLTHRVQSLELELETAKASAKAGGSGASREALDLRELLNKKDRDLLDLKDSVNNKEKQLLESRERLTDLERAKADLEDRSIGFEKNIADLNDHLANLQSDKETLTKKSHDLQGRIDAQGEKIKGLDDSLEKEIAARRAEVAALESAKVEALAERDRVKDAERAEALAAQKEELTAQKNKELDEQSAELREEAAKDKETELTQQRLRNDAAIEELTAKLEAEKDAALAAAAAKHENDMNALKEVQRKELAEYKSKLYDNEERNGQLNKELAEANIELKSVRDELTLVQGSLEESESNLSETRNLLSVAQNSLATTEGNLEDTRLSLENATAKIETLNADLAARTTRLASLESSLSNARDGLSRNGEIVAKARKALDLASTLLEQVDDGESDEFESVEE